MPAGPRVSLGGSGIDASSLTAWSRQSGSPALLPRAHPAPAPALSLSLTYAVGPSAPGTPYYSENGYGPPYSPGAPMSAARAAALAACASPRALGDVPLLLSEQRSEAARLAPPPLAQQPQRQNSERRTRNGSAGMVALGSADGLVAEKGGQLPRNYSSFGADSKWGFERNGSDGVFCMDADADMECV